MKERVRRKGILCLTKGYGWIKARNELTLLFVVAVEKKKKSSINKSISNRFSSRTS